MIKQIIVLVVALAVFGFGLYKLYGKGFMAGMDAYHKQCHSIGGYIINQENGTVVQCAPLSTVPKEERQGLDKSSTI